jgi:hypothetical protein
MIHPDTELRPVNEHIGLGVFATRPLPMGTIVWVQDELDQRIPPERLRRLGRRYEALLERYGFVNAAGETILCWDLGRWINHSCRANVLSSGWDFDVAVRDIAAGEELTTDYGELNIERSFSCGCAEPACRRRIRPDDFDRFVPVWDASVKQAFPEVTRVQQPLWQWVPNKREVSAASRRPERVPSVRSHQFLGGLDEPLRRVASRRL